MKIQDLLKPYREYLKFERLLAKDTLRAYSSDLRDLSAWWGKDVEIIARNDLREYMAHLAQTGQARATIRRKIQGLSTFFGWLEMERVITDNPTAHLFVPPRKKRVSRFLSIDELKRFVTLEPPTYQGCNPARDKLAFRLLAWLGIRRGELLNLRVEDVKTDVVVIREGKGGNDRELPLPDELKADLAAFIGNRRAGWLLMSSTGNQWGYASFAKAFRRHAKLCGFGLDVTPHTLRHTFGTHLAAANVPIGTISNLMGHKEIKTTMQYIHHTPAMRRGAMERHPLAPKPDQV